MASEERRIKERHAVLTDVGMVREHNEDSAHADPAGAFFIVADGMGGHAAGEVASGMAVEAVQGALEAAHDSIQRFTEAPSDEARRALVAVLENAVRQAHQSVYERGTRETDKHGMGTTLDVVLVAGPEAFVAHVGDSRTYLIRDGRASQITTDHTVAEVLVIEGKLSAEEAQISPLRTILVNAIGVAEDVGVEMAHIRLKQGDKLLLCSDGLHDYFPQEKEICEHVSGNEPPEALAHMIDLAKQRGGHDNITGIVLEVLDVPPSTEEEESLGDGGYEDTGVVPILSADSVPNEVGRDDTMPLDARGFATTLPPPGDATAVGSESDAEGEAEGDATDDSDATDSDAASDGASATKAKPKRRKKRASKGDTPDPDDDSTAADSASSGDSDS